MVPFDHDLTALDVARSSAVTERQRDASCHWKFRQVTQDHKKSHC